jgi:hypothetical protein
VDRRVSLSLDVERFVESDNTKRPRPSALDIPPDHGRTRSDRVATDTEHHRRGGRVDQRDRVGCQNLRLSCCEVVFVDEAAESVTSANW